MAVRIVNLRNAPEDEIDEIRALLEEHKFDFYETPGGSWGISVPSFWLKDESQLEQVKAVLETYQQQRQKRAADEYEKLRQQGLQPSMWKLFLVSPRKYIFYLALICLVLYLTLNPFLYFGIK